MSNQLVKTIQEDLYSRQTSLFHQYVDISLINNNTSGSGKAIPISFYDRRSSTILKHPSDYFLTVARMRLDSTALPSFIPQIEIGQSDINKTVYTFTMTYQSFEAKVNVMYEPTDKTVSVNAPTTRMDMTNTYYFCYNFDAWVDMLNKALKTCFTALAGETTLPNGNAPFFIYDSSSSSITLAVDTVFGLDDDSVANPIKLYMNQAMAFLLSGLKMNLVSLPDGKDYQVNVKSEQGFETLKVNDTYDAYLLTEDFSSTSLWSPIQSIVLTTNTIDINSTLVTVPKVFNSNVVNLSSNNDNVGQAVIMDLEVTQENGKEYKSSIYYSPSSQYRLVDCTGNSDLTQIEISIYWKSKFGELYPMYLFSGGSCDIKLLFIHKSMYLR